MPGKCLYVRLKGISSNQKIAAIRENAIIEGVSWYKASQCSEMRQTGWKRREMAFYARLKTLKVERKSK